MPTPVIADTFRCALLWHNPGSVLVPVNVLHVHAPGKTASQVATALQANITQNMFLCNESSWTQDEIDILPLDGATATQQFPGSGKTGAVAGDPIIACSVVVSLKTAQRGARGRGRVYCGPIVEAKQTSGKILTADATTIVTAWNTFVTAMNTAGCTLVVASYVHADQHAVTSERCDIPLGTQRRRQDRVAGR